ncbi:hypothetical protein L2E82_20954 [Cichorium intybus]|uniref:Uncharacterized protein n=1 Tax=Cichorium intybus TaxID=13427 RepID=A0ACB9DV34_CICIN|nr:hypothetical protein L2E82_20954 [Cichorium intybus]
MKRKYCSAESALSRLKPSAAEINQLFTSSSCSHLPTTPALSSSPNRFSGSARTFLLRNRKAKSPLPIDFASPVSAPPFDFASPTTQQAALPLCFSSEFSLPPPRNP